MDTIVTVLVHYNTDKETRACVDSLLAIEPGEYKHRIVILDNASKKPLKLPQELLDKVELLRSEANLGFTGGNNLAIAHALEHYKPDYVLLLNNDTLVEPQFLKYLYKFLKQNSQIGVVSPKIYFGKGYEFHDSSYKPTEKGKVLWYAGGSIDWRNLYAFHRGVDELDFGHYDSQTSSDFATGCCVLISRTALETAGVLDDRYFLYLEDVDLSVRIAQAGYGIGFCADSIVWHKNAGSSGGAGSSLHQYYQTRNRLAFFWKYGSRRVKLVVLKLAWQLLKRGNATERTGVWDWLLNRMGKRAVV